MKSLYKYLYEMICEANNQRTKSMFIAADYYKTNHTYALDVLRQILTHGYIEIEEYGSVKVEFIDEDLNAVRSYFNYNDNTKDFDISKKPSTVEEWNDMLSELGIPKWQKVWKGKFSNSKPGQIMESLVCYMFNDAEADIVAWGEKFTDVDAGWETSCRKLSEY
jgi:hypothetical protein